VDEKAKIKNKIQSLEVKKKEEFKVEMKEPPGMN